MNKANYGQKIQENDAVAVEAYNDKFKHKYRDLIHLTHDEIYLLCKQWISKYSTMHNDSSVDKHMMIDNKKKCCLSLIPSTKHTNGHIWKLVFCSSSNLICTYVCMYTFPRFWISHKKESLEFSQFVCFISCGQTLLKRRKNTPEMHVNELCYICISLCLWLRWYVTVWCGFLYFSPYKMHEYYYFWFVFLTFSLFYRELRNNHRSSLLMIAHHCCLFNRAQ